ncbi:esterase family protein [Curtobacterium sp. ISL-83]|uniref:alpha/beta hydrolase n=1 Tax=Curtobacterium sp. ISL-83 TaxID=2819145 RepID=UPI002035752B|nr:alpha/beta hydrolase-fold protein [Curtobacterium sp. ISL-83]
MFFNDGWWYLDQEGDVRGGIVLDNLAAKHDLPQMIGVFVDPGVLDVEGTPTKHRSPEYDAFNDTYASYLLDEVLPIIRTSNAVSDDPMMRGICGGSSGGNAAVTAAWTRPDGLGRAIAFNPSFAQMPGGNPTRPCSLPKPAGRRVSSSTPLTAICTGTNASATGSL